MKNRNNGLTPLEIKDSGLYPVTNLISEWNKRFLIHPKPSRVIFTSTMSGSLRGFTLIELLVVISIIAVLLGILIPSLNMARECGRATVCRANVRRLSTSLRLYLDGHDDRFPIDRQRSKKEYVIAGPYKRYQARWMWFMSEGMGYVINPYKYATEEEFNDALDMDNDYYLCPTLKDIRYIRNERNGAYGYNWQYLANSRPHPNDPTKYANYPVLFLQIKSPENTIAFCDSRGSNIPHGEHGYLVDPPKMAVSKNAYEFSPKSVGPLKYSPADARHYEKVNASFLDGHAESMTYQQIGYEVDPQTKRPIEKGLTEIGGPGDNHLWSGTGKDEP